MVALLAIATVDPVERRRGSTDHKALQGVLFPL
jgi:hypothetical protein